MWLTAAATTGVLAIASLQFMATAGPAICAVDGALVGGYAQVAAQCDTTPTPEPSSPDVVNVGVVQRDESAAERAYRAYLQMLHDRCVDMGEAVEACPPPPPPPGEPFTAEAAAAVDPITISDLAAFRPIVGELVVEPDGWGVIGTPTNFYATAETHTMQGELFDLPIEVRWTPTSYVFDYGDGTVEETEASGAAWSGPDQSWTETATSHSYASRDDVDASLTVVFTAEVNAGGGWFPVPGTLPVQAPAVGVKVFEVDTVLTDGDCAANPAAAGCG